ncbi:MAG: ferrous iron transport protein B [Acidobacteriota bacterium]|nr:ferrous iron transport protein B [Acidobacteriota bacterium]
MKTDSLPVVIFIGQPNSGKSTLFNAIAGHLAETSNFPGTTTTHTHSRVSVEGRELTIIDLPGTYSLTPQEPHERVPFTHVFLERPDLMINVMDASTLSRSLEFTLELIELGYPVIVALNMVDLAEKKGIKIDIQELEHLLGVPVIPTIAAHGRGVKELLRAALRVLDEKPAVEAPRWSRDVEDKIEEMEKLLPPDFPIVANGRFTAIKMIESGELCCDIVWTDMEPELKTQVDRIRAELENRRRIPAYEIIAAERHHLASKISEESSRVLRGRQIDWDKKIDDVIMHPFFGYVILAAVFLAFFLIIFEVGNPLETLLLKPIGGLKHLLEAALGRTLLFYLADGLLQGIGGGMAIVLPYFLPLLFLTAFLEDVGYLARAGFLLDSLMHRIGLHGKSVTPFILGFGCNVPAVVSTRMLESRRDRILTSLLIPFIPCSARTTIILALIGFYLGPWWALGFYLMNILLVAGLGRGMSRISRTSSPGLILEIPSLKIPTLGNIGKKTYYQILSFVKFAWPILIVGSIVLSILQFFKADRGINFVLAPFVEKGLGLPHELGVTLVFGFLRKELSLIMMLQALGVDYQNLLTVISKEQIIVFTVFVSFFIPCLSTFAILWREIGKKYAFLAAGLSISVALVLSWIARYLF